MLSRFNPGQDLTSWTEASLPDRQEILKGRFITLEPLSTSHLQDLYQNIGPASESTDPKLWNYMLSYVPSTLEEFKAFIEKRSSSPVDYSYSVIDNKTKEALGFLACINVVSSNGTIEIGHVTYSPKLQRTVQASEAFYVLAKYTFDLGFRRLEWKCDSENLRSRKAAKRFGFTYEGDFRQHMVIKGRNRDTSWFSLLDSEWSRVNRAFEDWLKVENIGEDGIQKVALRVSLEIIGKKTVSSSLKADLS